MGLVALAMACSGGLYGILTALVKSTDHPSGAIDESKVQHLCSTFAACQVQIRIDGKRPAPLAVSLLAHAGVS